MIKLNEKILTTNTIVNVQYDENQIQKIIDTNFNHFQSPITETTDENNNSNQNYQELLNEIVTNHSDLLINDERLNNIESKSIDNIIDSFINLLDVNTTNDELINWMNEHNLKFKDELNALSNENTTIFDYGENSDNYDNMIIEAIKTLKYFKNKNINVSNIINAQILNENIIPNEISNIVNSEMTIYEEALSGLHESVNIYTDYQDLNLFMSEYSGKPFILSNTQFNNVQDYISNSIYTENCKELSLTTQNDPIIATNNELIYISKTAGVAGNSHTGFFFQEKYGINNLFFSIIEIDISSSDLVLLGEFRTWLNNTLNEYDTHKFIIKLTNSVSFNTNPDYKQVIDTNKDKLMIFVNDAITNNILKMKILVPISFDKYFIRNPNIATGYNQYVTLQLPESFFTETWQNLTFTINKRTSWYRDK